MNKKLTSLLVAAMMPFAFSAMAWTPVTSSEPEKTVVQLVSAAEHETVLELHTAGFNSIPLVTPRGEMMKITSPGLSPLLQAGAPDLPKGSASIIIPDHARMEVEVEQSAYIDYPGVNIAPSKGSILRTDKPADIPFTFGEAYTKDAFFPGSLAELKTPFILRDFRGQAVWIYPFQYNPVTKTLRVYSTLRIHIYEAGEGGENMLTRKAPLTSLDPEFAGIYTSLFRNGHNIISYLPLEEHGDMLIISPAAYASALQPFMEWKARRGLKCEWVDVGVIGNSDIMIKSYIDSYYTSHDLKYILLVGDDNDVAYPMMSGGASDPSYGYLAGNDSYAEVMVGRFSANSVQDVQTMVQRSVEYEANPAPLGTWYQKGVGVASDLGPGDDGEMDWEHLRNIRTGMMNFGYTDVDELYDGSHGGADANGDPGVSDLVSAINDGRSVINYTGHGSQNSCVTTGFSSSDVPLLTNTGMLPFWWSVGCVHGEFNGGTCIAEVMTRAEYNGQPAGMVATFMSSINQYWDEPMDAQDEFDSLLTDCYVNNIKRTYGGISVNGCMKMNDTYTATGFDMTNTWHIFGDPSLVIRNHVPVALSATHDTIVPVGTSQLVVGCNLNGACITLTKGSTIIGMGYVSGNAVTLTFASLVSPDTLLLTATAFNGVPYSAQVMVIPASGPYVIYSASTVNDPSGNANGLPDFGEAIQLDVTLNNLGQATAGQVTAVLTTADPYVTITNPNASFGTMIPGASQSVPSAFSYTLSASVPDQHVITFNLQLTDSALNSWSNSLMQTVNAPLLHVASLVVDDATGNNNGFLDPGETANIMITTVNNGHSASPAAVGTLTSVSSFVTINSAVSSMGSIAAGGNYLSTLNVTLAPNMTFGSPFDLTYDVTAAAYPVSRLFSLSAGEILEDFESNTFTRFPWVNTSASPWLIGTSLPFQGSYCGMSGVIGNNQTTALTMQINVLSSDTLSFYQHVSTEPGYDFLRFYIDGAKQAEWSGNSSWTYQAYFVSAGIHQVRWAYEKDAGATAGADRVWLDNIKFPPMVLPTSTEDPSAASLQLIVYPNPVADETSLMLHAITPVKARITLLDMKGSLVREIANDKTLSGLETIDFSTASLSRGVYMIRVETGHDVQVLRLVK